MIVSELIKKLKAMRQDAEVCSENLSDEFGIENIIVEDVFHCKEDSWGTKLDYVLLYGRNRFNCNL